MYPSYILRLAEALPSIDFIILNDQTEQGGYAKENGFYDAKSRTIGIYLGAGRLSSADVLDTAMFQAGTHEVVHDIKADSSEKFLELRDAVRELMDADAFERAVSRRYEQYKANDPDFTRADAEEEVVANALEDILNSEQQMFRLAKGHKNIFSRIWQGIKDFFDRVFNAIGKFHAQSGESQLLDKLDKRYKKLEKNFIDILHSLGTETNSAEENISENKKEDQSAETEKSSKKSLKDELYQDYDKPITVEDVEVLRSIGRKSINEFTAEDIIKSQKWAYKFYKELGTKSPFFRAWFGDWRAEEKGHIEVVIGEPGKKYSAGKSQNKDIGSNISWGHDLKSETINHAVGEKASIIALGNIDDIVEKSIYFDSNVSMPTSKTKMPYTAFMHSFYTVYKNPNGHFDLIKLYVEEALSNNLKSIFKRGYELKDIKIIAGIPNSVLFQKEGLTEGTTATVISISNLFDLVKTYDKEFSPKPVNSLLLNDDGTPKVFYHGTRSNFDEFILQGKATYGRALGDGFYFTPDYQKAHKFANGLFSKGEDRGGIIMPVYLQMKNPYVIELDADRTKWHNEYNKGNYDGIIDLKNQTWYVEDSTQIKSATDNIGTFNKFDANIKHSRKDTSSIESREAIVRSFGELAATDGEKKIVKDYAKSIEKIDKSIEKKKELFLGLQELKGKTDSESKAQREKYSAEIQRINDEITKADESLLKIAAAEPFRNVVRKSFEKGYDKGFDAREGYILKTIAKHSHSRYYNKKDVAAAIEKAPKVDTLTHKRRGELADELTNLFCYKYLQFS